MLSKLINPAYIPRFVNIGLAVWLFLSAFIWPRNADPTMLCAFASALVGTFEIMAIMNNRVRFANTGMGILIICEGLIVHQYLPMSRIHDAVIGAAIVLVSFIRSPDMPGTEVDLGNPTASH